jgi:hypothetical protein
MPIWRWTVGDCTNDGLECLDISIRTAKRCYGSMFDWIVCSNAKSCLKVIESICLKNKVDIFYQNWESLPLPIFAVPSVFDANAEPGEPNGRQGSFWKICPPRIDISQHEIVVDNDIVFRRPFRQIHEFLNSNRPLVVTEKVFCHGKFYGCDLPINSGIYGLPPHFDFACAIKKKWLDSGGPRGLLFRDEQGLIASVLAAQNPIVVNDVIHILPEGKPFDATYKKVFENGVPAKLIDKMFFCKFQLSNQDYCYHLLSLNRVANTWFQKIKNFMVHV